MGTPQCSPAVPRGDTQPALATGLEPGWRWSQQEAEDQFCFLVEPRLTLWPGFAGDPSCCWGQQHICKHLQTSANICSGDVGLALPHVLGEEAAKPPPGKAPGWSSPCPCQPLFGFDSTTPQLTNPFICSQLMRLDMKRRRKSWLLQAGVSEHPYPSSKDVLPLLHPKKSTLSYPKPLGTGQPSHGSAKAASATVPQLGRSQFLRIKFWETKFPFLGTEWVYPSPSWQQFGPPRLLPELFCQGFMPPALPVWDVQPKTDLH